MNNNVYVPRPDGNGGYKAPKRQAQIKRKSKADIKAEGKSRVFNAIIIVLTIILFFSTMAFLKDVTKKNTYIYKTPVSSMLYNIQNGDYTSLIRSWEDNLEAGSTVAKEPDYKEVYALAEYGKTLFRFRVYTEHGYTEKAAELAEILDKDLENVGELDFAVSVFNDIVGLDY